MNAARKKDLSRHLESDDWGLAFLQIICELLKPLQPSSRCGAVLVGLALLAIVPKICFGLKGKAMGVHLVCMLNDFFNSWSSRLMRPVKTQCFADCDSDMAHGAKGAQFTTPKI